MAGTKKLNLEDAGAINVPYLMAYGNVAKVFEKIKIAATPSRFTLDFLAAKLGMSGGSARPLVPFLKRTGFLNSDGTPTQLYKEFRNEALRAVAAGKAVKIGYAALYEIHEYVHDLNDKDLKGVIVQATGLDADSSTVKAIIGSFKALRSLASFDGDIDDGTEEERVDSAQEFEVPVPVPTQGKKTLKTKEGGMIDMKLGYTINLNLPATADIAVFNAIFKSLREHLLD